ncbi:MAG: TonB family protein [Verrucomicrobia bacterium]|nr:MAG: TonB family protein [Verrucomicrobiota bacterium]
MRKSNDAKSPTDFRRTDRVGRALTVLIVLAVGIGPARSARGQSYHDLLPPTLPPGAVIVQEDEIDPDIAPNTSIEEENRRAVNRPARLLTSVPPQYPDEFEGTGVVGEVVISLLVDRMGRASHIKVENSPDQAFTDAALDALARWEFLPAMKAGRLTNSRVRLSMLVSEEMGESSYFDYEGGAISLEGVRYAGETDRPIQRMYGLRAAYPWDQLVAGQPGEVVAEFSVDADGQPYDFEVLESTNRAFSRAAEAALLQWRYSPALKEGRPVIARLRYRVSFQIGDYAPEVLALARALDKGDYSGVTPANALDEQPRVLRAVTPVLPTELERRAGRRKVKINLVITEDGEPLIPRIESAPNPLFGYAALTAINYWRFAPAIKDAQPVRVNVTLPLTF